MQQTLKDDDAANDAANDAASDAVNDAAKDTASDTSNDASKSDGLSLGREPTLSGEQNKSKPSYAAVLKNC